MSFLTGDLCKFDAADKALKAAMKAKSGSLKSKTAQDTTVYGKIQTTTAEDSITFVKNDNGFTYEINARIEYNNSIVIIRVNMVTDFDLTPFAGEITADAA